MNNEQATAEQPRPCGWCNGCLSAITPSHRWVLCEKMTLGARLAARDAALERVKAEAAALERTTNLDAGPPVVFWRSELRLPPLTLDDLLGRDVPALKPEDLIGDAEEVEL